MVGKLIREARSNLGLTYEELAILCEMTPRYLQRIEEGKVAKPHVKTLKVVSDYLKLDFHQLMESCGYLKPDLPEKTLADLVRTGRLHKRYSQENLAKLCGISRQTLGGIERGKSTKPQRMTMRNLAYYLDLELDELMKSSGYWCERKEKTLAALVRSARLHKGYSQENLARLCGMGKQTLVAIERGKSTKPQPITMKKLADYLDLELDEVMKNSGYQYEREEKTLADIVRNARLHKGYSQDNLAKLCGISKKTLSYIEKGNGIKPRIVTLKILSDYLELDIHKLREICGY